MATTVTATAQSYLEALADELDISDTRYEQAHESYESLGRWLNRPVSTIKQFDPSVYVQGSFGLGTVIKPFDENGEYDVDSVCELRLLDKSDLTQEQLKTLVGIEIEAYRRSKGMVKPLEERRRCWTLRYSDGAQFHMDVVPALPNNQSVRVLLEKRHLDTSWVATAIAITDNERLDYKSITDDWQPSNPKGYLQWFKSRMIAVLQKRKRVLAEKAQASVESIPDYRVRTPLQSAIMILKHHRDIMYQNDEINCCPISIIITTLAAHAYQGEEEIADALVSILSRMEHYIQRDGQNRAVISNPSYPPENFADKWLEFPEREEAFYRWLRQAQKDFAAAAAMFDRGKITESLAPHMGVELAKRAETRSGTGGSGMLRSASAAAAVTGVAAPSFANVPRTPTKPQGFA